MPARLFGTLEYWKWTRSWKNAIIYSLPTYLISWQFWFGFNSNFLYLYYTKYIAFMEKVKPAQKEYL